jgi:hypothetical protein
MLKNAMYEISEGATVTILICSREGGGRKRERERKALNRTKHF